MKKSLKIFLIIIFVLFVLLGGFVGYMIMGQKEILNLKINNIDLSTINDGTYEGAYNNTRWTNKVSVTIKDHKITDVVFTKLHVFDKPQLREEIINDIKKKQSLDIDTVSGSTVSTKAYLKAILDALK